MNDENEKYLLPKLYRQRNQSCKINDIRRQAQWYNNFDKGGMKWRLMCPKFIWVANLYMLWTGNRMQSAKGVNTILKTEKNKQKNTKKKQTYKWKHT